MENPVTITNNDRGPIVNCVSWVMLVTMCLAALGKVLSGSWKTRAISLDSIMITGAMLMAIGQTIAVTKQVSSGLAKRVEEPNVEQLAAFEKAGYASEILYLSSLAFGKFATLAFVFTLAQTQISRTALKVTNAFVGLWTIVGIFGVAFQCSIPNTWAITSDKCFDQSAFWYAIGSLDVLIDLMLIGLPIFVLWDLQIPWTKKISVMSAFGARAAMFPLTISRMVFISQAVHSEDRLFDSYSAAVVTQIGINLAILLACFPFLKTFMDHVQNGLFTTDLRVAPGARGNTQAYAMGGYSKGSAGKKSQNSKSTSTGTGSSTTKSVTVPTPDDWAKMQPGAIVTTTRTEQGSIDTASRSRASSGGSDKMIIKHTTDFTVHSESAEPSSTGGRP